MPSRSSVELSIPSSREQPQEPLRVFFLTSMIVVSVAVVPLCLQPHEDTLCTATTSRETRMPSSHDDGHHHVDPEISKIQH